MKAKMLKKMILFVGFTAFFPLLPLKVDNPTMLTIPVQFPPILETVPPICMYYCGYRIKPDDAPHTNKILFSILENRLRTHFWLVITDIHRIQPEILSANTINYLKIRPEQKYKFYSLLLVAEEQEDTGRPNYRWEITECPIPAKDGRLPDDTLIVSYDPDLVDHLEGGTALELPTIMIKPNVLTIVGSEALLHEKSVELLLSSLDYNAIHANIKHEIRYDQNSKTIRTLTT